MPTFKDKAKDLYGQIRSEFIFLMTTNSQTQDARRKEFNQAIFNKDGKCIWSDCDIYMILEKFDNAVKNVKERNK